MQCSYKLCSRIVVVSKEVCYKIVSGGWIVESIFFPLCIRALYYNALSFSAHWSSFPIYYELYCLLNFFFPPFRRLGLKFVLSYMSVGLHINLPMNSLRAVEDVVSGRHIAIQTKLSALEPVCSFGFVVLYFLVLCHWHEMYRVSARCMLHLQSF